MSADDDCIELVYTHHSILIKLSPSLSTKETLNKLNNLKIHTKKKIYSFTHNQGFPNLSELRYFEE